MARVTVSKDCIVQRTDKFDRDWMPIDVLGEFPVEEAPEGFWSGNFITPETVSEIQGRLGRVIIDFWDDGRFLCHSSGKPAFTLAKNGRVDK